MKVRVNTYHSDQFACFLHSQNTVNTCRLPEWALLALAENERSVRTKGFAKLFYSLLGAQIIRNLSYCGKFEMDRKSLLLPGLCSLMYQLAISLTAANTVKQFADIKKATQAAAVLPYS
jgi:hypothetical protein